MKFQNRDGEILKAIYANDGVLAKRHLKALFWPDKTWRAMQVRLSKLFRAGYIEWPDRSTYKTNPIPEPVCWLGWRGILFIAGMEGVRVTPPVRLNENQLRQFQSRLRKSNIRWVREPHWNQLSHDLAIVDVRLAIEQSVWQLSTIELENWQTESAFRSAMDVIEYKIRTRNGHMATRKRGVIPDGFFAISDKLRREQGKPHRARFLLELDMASHDNTSFGMEKIAPGAAYIRSSSYRSRFGVNSGIWLVMTTGETRMKNLMKQTVEIADSDSNLFYFTTFDNLNADNLLTSLIWYQAGKNAPVSLLDF